MSVSLPLHRQARHARATLLARRLLLSGLAFVALAQPAAAQAWHGSSERSESVDRFSPCLASRPVFGAYGWPVKPFDRPHPVRGNLGDPRTSFFGTLRGGPGTPGIFLFHNGVDISAPDGTAVYPVVSGRVTLLDADHITVSTYDHRRFQYWHIKPLVVVGEAVTSDQTILGHILPGLGHVHLTEIDGYRVVNPLLTGHLFPYHDSKAPRVDSVIVTGAGGRALAGPTVADSVGIEATAHDVPSIVPPGRWHDAIVTPATITWSLDAQDGTIVRGPTTVFDVRHSLPPKREFWDVYGSGTFQNFPVSTRIRLSVVGNYVFRLGELNTESLANGLYELTVKATDICGNAGTLRTAIQVANPAEGRPAGGRAV